MSEISFFQYYSQSENHTTNNTLLVLRHFYRKSSRKLEEILSSFIDETLDIGPVFRQQIRSSQSVPDALISQQSFNIFFEVKGSGQRLRDNQIENHIKSIKNDYDPRSLKILFALTQEPIPTDQANRLLDLAKKEGVIFKAITFSELLEALQRFCASHETELKDILDDYKQYLASENLLELVGEIMYVVPVRYSIEENIKFRLYYEPVHRKLRASSKFFGLYTNKCIRYVGRVNAVVAGGLNKEGQFEVAVREDNKEQLKDDVVPAGYKPTDEELQRITDAIHGCASYHPNVWEGHRFYLFDEFEETDFRKESKGPLLLGPREFNLSDWIDYKDKKEYTTAEVAEKLRKHPSL